MEEADESESVTGGLLKGDEMTLAGLDEVDDLRSSSAVVSELVSCHNTIQPDEYDGVGAEKRTGGREIQEFRQSDPTSIEMSVTCHDSELLAQMRNLGLEGGIALQHTVDLVALGAQLSNLMLQALNVLLGARANGALGLAVVGALALQLLGCQRSDFASARARLALFAGRRRGRLAPAVAVVTTGRGGFLGHGSCVLQC